jgi:DNA polymerase-1
MSRHLLIDADILVYRFAHSEQVVCQWERDLFTQHAYLAPAVGKVDAFIQDMLETTESDACTLVLSDLDGNFRKNLPLIDYKANRAGTVRPILFKPLREHFQAQYGAIVEPMLEGDDLLGLLGTLEGSEEMVIASIDKDLKTVPGLHFNWDGEETAIVEVTPEEAQRFHLIQTLMGDSTDGYRGVPGIGLVKATRLMVSARLATAWEDVVVPAFGKAGLNEEVALRTAQVAHVLQGDDYDFDTKNIKLWEPKR